MTDETSGGYSPIPGPPPGPQQPYQQHQNQQQPYQPFPPAGPPPLPTYQLGHTFQKPWRNGNVGLGYAVVVLLGLNVIENVRTMIEDYQLMGLVADGDFETIAAGQQTQLVFGLIGLALVIATGVVFLIWQHRIWTSDRANALVYTRTAGFAVGGWCIPFANFVLAPRALRDLWWATSTARPGMPPTPPTPTPRYKMPGLVIGWLVVWILSAVFAATANQNLTAAGRETTVSGLSNAIDRGLNVEMVGCVTTIAAAVIMVVYVLQIQGFTKR